MACVRLLQQPEHHSFHNKTTPGEDFDEVHKVILYGISSSMEYLLHTRKYCAINEADPKTIGY